MELSETQKGKLEQAAKKHGLTLVLLFGSRADGGVHAESDWDVAVQMKGFDWMKYSELTWDIAEALGVPSERLDLSSVDIADPLFLKKISDTSVVLYGDSRAYQGFLLKAFHRYEDYKPFLAQEAQAVGRYVRQYAYAH
ncbi:hypothetical protein A3J43_00580 [Candidatus Uhrbacteria bacterium RIFCSPHIGHO2_12_FULL_54_23]|uniref:Polymerase beta nucleotidyltransferase domain-containing protein n=3 Tax=Candidatus Uhriibacteriota TaxID=1752732 RepID=A0A1F7UGA3_9BACT|nr:MAG: hypothetical protein A3J43_00580 [Candidatus Uhrbacteria bacterium RIFCSPHIGHO2_12_FULL_54_23]OGL85264.1 MAG: hypothetical protein A3B36_00170 [Candidatus Uhrbacteria bacterium RIFCSPLOWO2_01_FULL_55_36]OGL89690.1 MAG: hypothetical protein A3J36_01315 [Candidatus Uhrbacteria bacterium RIFCSPLOWO2_02_FULL_54_37]